MDKTVSDRNDEKFRTNTQDQSNPIEIQTSVLDIEQMQANGSAWAATPVLGRTLFWASAHPAGAALIWMKVTWQTP